MLSQSSRNSTNCSSPHNDTLEKVIKNDTVRYVRKGYGLVVAILIYLAFFILVPYVVKDYWGKFISLANENKYFFFIFFLAQHHTFFVISNTMMYIIYRFKIPFFERYRIYPNKPWPWEESKEKWSAQMKKTAKFLIFNNFVLIPVAFYFDFRVEMLTFRYDVESFPTLTEILPQITFFMICEDFAFYWLHRILHLKAFYPFIHKIHHEYNNTIAIASEYAHPVEYFLANMVPVVMGMKILGRNVHMFTFAMYVTIRIFETVDGHCGYEFSWSPYRLLPLSGSSSFHNYHHSHNDGNYGSFFMIWDTMMGTNKYYFQYLARKEREESLRKLREEYQENKGKGVLDSKELQEKLEKLTSEGRPKAD